MSAPAPTRAKCPSGALEVAIPTVEAAIAALDTVRDCYHYGAWSEWTARKRAAEDRAVALLITAGADIRLRGGIHEIRLAGIRVTSTCGLRLTLCHWRRRAREALEQAEAKA